MRKPDEPVIENIRTMTSEIERHQTEIVELRERIDAEVSSIQSLQCSEHRARVAIYIYWTFHNVHKAALARASFEGDKHQKRFAEAAALMFGELHCADCDAAFLLPNRDRLREFSDLQSDGTYVVDPARSRCDDCIRANRVAEEEDKKRRQEEWYDFLKKLPEMSYDDYTASKFWKQRCERYLADVRRRKRVENPICESCKIAPAKNVMHRSRRKIGYEPFADLMAFCDTCANAAAMVARGMQ